MKTTKKIGEITGIAAIAKNEKADEKEKAKIEKAAKKNKKKKRRFFRKKEKPETAI